MAKRDHWEQWEDVPTVVARQVVTDISSMIDACEDLAVNSEGRDASHASDTAAAFRLLLDELRERYMDAEPKL